PSMGTPLLQLIALKDNGCSLNRCRICSPECGKRVSYSDKVKEADNHWGCLYDSGLLAGR
ncbi:MAG: hypothetical protein KAJ09_05845, partial [Deltaproteobacteria bacterium]|nr:hypothetical protein [Deltaproteobacteria bacterium]